MRRALGVAMAALVLVGWCSPTSAQDEEACWGALTELPLETIGLPGGLGWARLALDVDGWKGLARVGPDERAGGIGLLVTCWPDPVRFVERTGEIAGPMPNLSRVGVIALGDASTGIREDSLGTTTTLWWAHGGFLASASLYQSDSRSTLDMGDLEDVAAAVDGVLGLWGTGGSPRDPAGSACIDGLIAIPIEGVRLPPGLGWSSLRFDPDDGWFGLLDDPRGSGLSPEIALWCGIDAGVTPPVVSDADFPAARWQVGGIRVSVVGYGPLRPDEVAAIAAAIDSVLPR